MNSFPTCMVIVEHYIITINTYVDMVAVD